MKWIDIKETEPPMFVRVLFYVEYREEGESEVDRYIQIDERVEYSGAYSDDRRETYTHWLPLPEPPKVEEKQAPLIDFASWLFGEMDKESIEKIVNRYLKESE